MLPSSKGKKLHSMPIDAVIQKILVVQEEQQLTEEGKEIYDVKLTRGIIFDLGDHQVSFEKVVWFSEDIIVRKGYELINKFLSTEELCKKDNWQENMEMQCSRTIDLIK